MTSKNILIVEDDRHISKLVKYNLEKAGFDCTVVITGEDALNVLDTQAVDLIILDIMLPKMDGFEMCREIKKDKRLAQIPLIMLTARGEEVDKVLGLELGADDYIVKPFSPRELILRVKAILRRGKPKEDGKEILNLGNLTVDLPRHSVKVKNRAIKLTAMEFKLLAILLKRKGRVQSREQLLSDVWNLEADVTTRTVDTHIKRLRQKLGTMGKNIQTVHGYGYKIKEEE